MKKKRTKPSPTATRRHWLKIQSQIRPLLDEKKLSALNAAITAQFRVPSESLRRRLMTEEERFIEDAEKKDREYWARVVNSIRNGALTEFYEDVYAFGPHAYANPQVQKALRDLWFKALKDETAREILRKICPPLATLDPGRPATLTERQKEENKRGSNRIAQQTARALKYCQRMWSFYEEKIRGVPDIIRRQRIADLIAKMESARGSTAKREGIRLFLAEVKKDLAGRTVRKK
jgi:hypothetical protein